MAITSSKQLKQFYSDQLAKLTKVEAKCRHFGECGGCSWQHLEYSQQLALKSEALTQIMSGMEWGDIPVVAAPDVLEYRTRMDYVCSHDPFHPPTDRLGLRKRKHFNHVIDLQECHLIPPGMFGKVRSVYSEAVKQDIPIYDLVSGKGELRYLVTRTNGTQQMLIIITVSTGVEEQIQRLAEFALTQGFSSVYWLLQPQASDISFGEVERYWGDEYLVMTVGESRQVELAIGPNNFFQSNISQFNKLMDHVAANLHDDSLLVDLYCGVGTIGLLLADRFAQVIGVESVQSSIDLAIANAERNHISNVDYHCGDIAKLAAEVPAVAVAKRRTVIVDPPRAGLTPAGVAEVVGLSPQQLIYISCNPVTQAQDLELLRSDYKLESITGFDMFPQTLHMESVAILSAK